MPTLHYDDAGAAIGAVALEPFLGRCRVVHAIGCGPLLRWEHFAHAAAALPERVLVRTYARAPVDRWDPDLAAFAPETVERLADLGVVLIGIETDHRRRLARARGAEGTAMTRDEALALDAADALAPLREQFSLPPGLIYLDGNSLGVLPKATAARVQQVVQQEWGVDLIRSWNTAGWIDLPQRVGDKIARLVGASPGELVVADSTSVNLFKVLSAALSITQADS